MLIRERDSSRLTESIHVLPELGERTCRRMHPSFEPFVRERVFVLLSGLIRLLTCDVVKNPLFFGLFIEQSIVTIIMRVSSDAHAMASLLLKYHPMSKQKIEQAPKANGQP